MSSQVNDGAGCRRSESRGRGLVSIRLTARGVALTASCLGALALFFHAHSGSAFRAGCRLGFIQVGCCHL